jgi:hypothetical protein
MISRRFRSGSLRRTLSVPVGIVFLLTLGEGAAAAQQATPEEVAALRAEISAVRAEYDRRLSELESRLSALAGSSTEAAATIPSGDAALAEAAPPEPAPAEAREEELTEEQVAAELGLSAAPSPPSSAASPSASYFNPAMSVIGNVVGVAGDENPFEQSRALELRESEVSLQAAIDPYAKGDLFLAFSNEGVEVEEGFVTFTALPGDLLVRAGKMRVAFGKTNPLHGHVLPWADTPLPLSNLLGGDEGWVGTGVSAARLIPLPADTFSEATLMVLDGEAEGLFEPEERSDLSYALRYRVFRDLTEATNLDLGASWGRGLNGSEEGAETTLQGFDLTLRWKPLRTALYRSFVLRGEAIRSRREGPGDTQDSLGWFVAADHQLARRWFVGGRYESAERADDETLRDTGRSLALTFKPSEFSLLRGQLRRRDYALLGTTDELLLQLQFAMGAHGAHPF